MRSLSDMGAVTTSLALGTAGFAKMASTEDSQVGDAADAPPPDEQLDSLMTDAGKEQHYSRVAGQEQEADG